MFAIVKPVAVLAASAVLLLLALFTEPGTATAEITLGRVLDLAAQADSLQIEVVSEGKRAEVLVSGDSVRWEDSSKRYRIAKGSRLWTVDEAAEEVTESGTPWSFRNDEIDLISLLGNTSSAKLRTTRPVRQIEHAGHLCNVFQFQATGGDPVIRAFANAKTNELYSIAAFAPDTKPGSGPPLAELRLVARNIDIDESKFVVGRSFSRDDRVGTLRDAQGIVQLRPKVFRRWTLVTSMMLLKPGDWVRTDVRGANAVSIELTSGHRLTVGPGSLIQMDDAGRVTLHRGEVRIAPDGTADSVMQLDGPEQQLLRIEKGKPRHVRLDSNQQFVDVQGKPLWLAGFEGTSSNESLGSLIANVDGRSTPLTVGFHKVKVEIRDQIARTTIEESFVNHTKSRLEGVFHFPLPQDASISGFGMWIGGELIEADVVEKQRAREIYETILRERRDPGLLEWAGGNIFKARVFPIEPHSEKRIKIVYTQVLPMRANTYRYAYGLRSEMLQKTPLRELSLEVLVHSALKLKSVTCPTHSVRSQLTEHSASLEFAAQEYTPKRDFEVVCEVDSKESDVVVIPHRRGDDGYFLAQVTPPVPAGSWQREILPDGMPLNLMLVCDTSASMSTDTRMRQKQFVSSVLSSLNDDDRFSIAVSDVDTLWKSKNSTAAGEKPVGSAISWLENRKSLGWTDLDRMLASVRDRLTRSRRRGDNGSGSSAQLDENQLPAGTALPDPSDRPSRGEGDGVRLSSADGAALNNTHVIYIGDGIVTARDADPQAFVNRLRQAGKDIGDVTFHAISIGSSFESNVLKSIASIGGGSVRQIDGEQTPQRVARELLNEMAQPGLRDLKVEFKGIQVAAVYPSELPNLAAGTQQILIGRYLPTGEDQTGQIVVTGTRNGERVKYSSRIVMKDAEAGNSFVPRLWARSHLDHLLQQGSNEFIKDEIISLSEEFHIMTPYTSLLVLETDADRERFGVKRRFLMRDGEKFFAKGRSEANFQLLQQQMKAAGNWRLGMRRRILSQLAGLGRDISVFTSQEQMLGRFSQSSLRSGSLSVSSAVSRQISGGGFGEDYDLNGVAGFGNKKLRGLQTPGDSPILSVDAESKADFELAAVDEVWAANQPERDEEEQLSELSAKLEASREQLAFKRKRMDGFQQAAQYAWESSGFNARDRRSHRSLPLVMSGPAAGEMYPHSEQQPYRVSWLNELVPQLPDSPPALEGQSSKWPERAGKLAASLVQPMEIPERSGVEVKLEAEYTDVRWNRTTSRNTSVVLSASDRWLSAGEAVNSNNVVNWCTGDIRGVYSTAFRLGRRRASTHADVTSTKPGNRPFAWQSVEKTYSSYSAEVKEEADDRSVLILTPPQTDSERKLFITIDADRHVVLKSEWKQEGRTTSSTEYSDYVKIAGCWWPQKIQQRDADGKITSIIRQTITVLAEDVFAEKFEKLLPEDDVLMLPDQLPSVREARIASDNGNADVAELLVLMASASRIQDWVTVLDLLDKAEAAAGGRPGLKWIRLAVLQSARRNETLRVLASTLVTDIVRNTSASDLFLVHHVWNRTHSISDQNERLMLLDTAKPVFDRQPEYADAAGTWKLHRATALQQLNRTAESIPLYKEVAESRPWDYSVQASYAQQLAAIGEHSEAVQWLRKQIDQDVKRPPHEIQHLRQAYADLLRQKHLVDDLVAFTTEWIQQEPTNQNVYAQHLAALRAANRSGDANQLAGKWLGLATSVLQRNLAASATGESTDSSSSARLTPSELAKLNAAVSFALGQGYGTYQNYIDPEWHEPLADAVISLLKNPNHFSVAGRIVSDYRFLRSDEVHRVRAEAAQLLRQTAADIHPAQLGSLLNQTLSFSDFTPEDWSKTAETLRKRWDDEDNDSLRDELSGALTRLYAHRFSDSLYRPFLRDCIERETKADRPQVVDRLIQNLFDVLLGQPWTSAKVMEDEAFALLVQLHQSRSESQAMFTRVPALYRLVDRMYQVRIEAEEQKLQSDGHPEELTRTELASRRKGFRVSAWQAIAKRLAEEANRLQTADDVDAQALADWIRVEQMHLQLQLADNADETSDISAEELKQKVRRASWEILGTVPIEMEDGKTNPDTGDQTELIEQQRVLLKSLLQDRVFVIASSLSLRRDAPDGESQKLLDYIDAGIAQNASATVWKSRRASLLIALDRPEPLEKSVRQWIREDEYAAPYQLLLARLLAEQGNIDEAIVLFETVQRRETLSPSDYSALANWYMVADRKEDYRKARIEVFKALEEWKLNQYIQQKQRRWSSSGITLPTELDEDVLLAFQALFEKSAHPGNYVYQLKNFYTACRDFRLLKMVPDAVVGRTQQQIYSFLTQLNGNLMVEVRNEATADELVNRVQEIRDTSETPVDQRALDLLEAMVERRSANVLNQPGPHIDAAVAAMKRAFSREWASGEVLQMATFLRDMGTIPHPKLADERLRQLRALHGMTTPGTDERFNIAWMLAHALFHSHNERENALALMQNALSEFRTNHPGGLPGRLNSAFKGYIGLLRTAGRFSEGEILLLQETENALNVSQMFFMKQQLNELYHDALKNKAPVSLGSEKELYVHLLQHLLAESEINNDSYRYQCMSMIVNVFRTMTGQPEHEDRSHVRKYAFEQFPELLDDRAQNYRSLVEQTADLVSLLLGDRAGIDFLVERMENYPVRFRGTYESAWRQFSHRLAQWRRNVGQLPEKPEARLLRIVLAELRRDLTTQQQYNRSIFNKTGSYFWVEKANDFLQVANKVASENADSGNTMTHVAEFVYSSLRQHDRAIELMFEAHDRGVLDPSQQHRLVGWLFRHKRHAEAIPILKPLVEKYPDDINHRTQLITAYTRTSRGKQARKLLGDTENHFRQPGRWTESNVAQLAYCCRDSSLMQDAVRLYGEVIPMHQRSQPNRGIGQGTLSGYYDNLAHAHSVLGNTVDAVDAAASAIISWGPQHSQRSSAVSRLESVLSRAKDLDNYAEHLDRESQASGTDSPVIRKTLGRVYAAKNRHNKAITQLKAAIELQPTDPETHSALIASYKATEQSDAVVSQMLAQLNFDRHNLKLYEALSEQLAGSEEQAERAATTIVEAAPLEAAHHHSLAELRERQKRWSEAIIHWQHVAKLRSLEPTGLIHLAEAQINGKRFAAARRTVTALNAKAWPARFGNVQNEVQRLEKLIP